MQQINLYQAILRQPREVLSPRQVGLLLLGLSALLGAVNALQVWQGHRSNNRLEQLRAEQQTIIATVQTLNQEIAARNVSGQITAQLTELDRELQNKQQVLQLLTGKRFGNVDGFATQFSGLARQRIEGLWLTELYIHEGGEKLNIRGTTTQPELLPRYLQRLAKEPIFHGVEFKTFVMQRDKEHSQVNFDLRSSSEDKAK
jgi:hypothetical protein